MKRIFIAIMLFFFVAPALYPVWPQNPFTSKPETQYRTPEPLFKSRFFAKLVLWQQQLKQKMSELIRTAQTEKNIRPLLFVMGVAFSYGMIHAAGPGHGKVIAMTYVLSHKASIIGGLFFGFFIALIHGFSAAVGVLGLRYILQKGISDTLATVTDITQLVSFGLIVLLGLGLLLKNGYALFFKTTLKSSTVKDKTTPKGVLPWALAVGLVPCPAVVMVMLFCLSMEVMILGLLLAGCISFGMATTISVAVTMVIMGKAGVFNRIPTKHMQTVETVVGLLSGIAIAVFGTLFFLTTLNSFVY